MTTQPSRPARFRSKNRNTAAMPPWEQYDRIAASFAIVESLEPSDKIKQLRLLAEKFIEIAPADQQARIREIRDEAVNAIKQLEESNADKT